MSAGGSPKFPSAEKARAAQWFSRRHPTSEAHEEAKQRKVDEASAHNPPLAVLWTKKRKSQVTP